MTLEQLLQWALLPALAGVGWIARNVSRLETRVDILERNNAELWKRVNQQAGEISDIRASVANIEGRLSSR